MTQTPEEELEEKLSRLAVLKNSCQGDRIRWLQLRLTPEVKQLLEEIRKLLEILGINDQSLEDY